MTQRTLTEEELRALSAWASVQIDRTARDQIHLLIGELRALRDRESVVRHLHEQESEV